MLFGESVTPTDNVRVNIDSNDVRCGVPKYHPIRSTFGD